MAFKSVSLADVKALRRHFDVRVNDVALALCSGALRTYLQGRGELPNRSLTAGIPVSIRAEGDASLDNQLSYLVVPIATDVADPEARLRAIVRHTAAAKEVHKVMRANPVGSIGDTAPPFVLGTLLRLAYEAHVLSYVPGMMNTIVSNVPGPPMTLYMGGARLTGIFSASVLLDQMGPEHHAVHVRRSRRLRPPRRSRPRRGSVGHCRRDPRRARGAHGGRRARRADASRGRVRHRFRRRTRDELSASPPVEAARRPPR